MIVLKKVHSLYLSLEYICQGGAGVAPGWRRVAPGGAVDSVMMVSCWCVLVDCAHFTARGHLLSSESIEESEGFRSIQISTKKSPGALRYAPNTEFRCMDLKIVLLDWNPTFLYTPFWQCPKLPEVTLPSSALKVLESYPCHGPDHFFDI